MAKILATPVTGIIYALRHKTATLRSLMTLWFCHFPFQYLPENYTGNGRGGSE